MSAALTSLTDVGNGTHENYRLIILDGNGRDFLVRQYEGSHLLLEVQIPRFTRTLQLITDHVRSTLGFSSTLLFWEPSPISTSDINPIVLEGPKARVPVRGHCWCDVRRAEAILMNAEDARLVESLHSRVVANDRSARTTFNSLGWIYELQTWVENVLGGDKVQSFSQLGGSESTCLIRFNTRTQTYWYKAVGLCDPREYFNTVTLAKYLNRFLPTIRAFDCERHAWLMESGGDTTLRDHQELSTWAMVASDLAFFQMESARYVAQLLEGNCIDLRNRLLLESIEPFFVFLNDLMSRQVKSSPCPLSTDQLNETAGVLRGALEELDTLHLPTVIGHSDFNPGNVLISPSRSLVVDWSAAHVGSPVLTIEYLIAHHRKTCPHVIDRQHVLGKVYVQNWSRFLPAKDLHRALQLSPIIAPYAAGIANNSWRDPARLAVPGMAGYLRSLARIMYREAQSLIVRKNHA